MRRMFGRDHIVDHRDRKFALGTTASPRVKRYWRDYDWFGDQEISSACVGFSWAHWLNSSPISNYLNPYGLYNLAKHLDEWDGVDYDGTSVRAGAKVLHKLGLIRTYRWATTLAQLVPAVLDKGPVVVGTHWYEGMTDTSDGVLRLTGASQGGHAWLLTGVDTRKRLFRMKNSWGRTWANKGRAVISFEDMRRLLKRQGEACLATERVARPTTP